jgi:hypothetical protein
MREDLAARERAPRSGVWRIASRWCKAPAQTLKRQEPALEMT